LDGRMVRHLSIMSDRFSSLYYADIQWPESIGFGILILILLMLFIITLSYGPSGCDEPFRPHHASCKTDTASSVTALAFTENAFMASAFLCAKGHVYCVGFFFGCGGSEA
jgi:hypothetical protein